jgi:hypothetical protein
MESKVVVEFEFQLYQVNLQDISYIIGNYPILCFVTLIYYLLPILMIKLIYSKFYPALKKLSNQKRHIILLNFYNTYNYIRI